MNVEENQLEVMNDVLPIAPKDRTLGGKSNFAIWFACNFVTTTMLTGMYYIPGLTFATAMRTIVFGCLVGIIPLVLIGVIGQKTGLVTMVVARSTFGSKGAILPSAINVIILVAWSWAQAGLGGYALNYALKTITGVEMLSVCIILTELIVLAVSLYAIKGIAAYEKAAMALIAVIMGTVFYQAFTITGLDNIFALASDPQQGMTVMATFDIVVATALSWTPMAADYNRNCKTVKGAVVGTGAGFALGTILSMGSGALMIGMILAGGLQLSYEPAEVFGEIGFGLAGAVVIFVSIIAANVMCIYSATMSFINIFPKHTYKKTAIVIGAICVFGALFSGILDAFLSFIGLIGVLFMPIFAIMIADFFVVKRQKLSIDAVVFPDKYKDYFYSGGINWIAMGVFVISAAVAFYLTIIHPIAVGGTIPTFILAFCLYSAAMKFADRRVK